MVANEKFTEINGVQQQVYCGCDENYIDPVIHSASAITGGAFDRLCPVCDYYYWVHLPLKRK